MQQEFKARPKAYSYIRMSTEKQMSGDSLRRQMQNSRNYATEHGLDLDETLKDIGISAYSGDNLENGALGKFLQLVKTDKIAKGSYLIVESLDRLSRKNVLEALPPFLEIMKAGITIVTLADRQVYSHEIIRDNPYQLMGSLVVMIRANEESATKSKRIKEAMTKMREAAMNGEGRYNINLPSWIDAEKDSKGNLTYKLNDHANTVKLIYELAAEGIGQMEICRILHKRNIPVFKKAKKGWHQSAVAHLLSYPAVIGTYQAKEHQNGNYVVTGKPRLNYFPAAIDEDLYFRAQAARRKPPHRGRKGNDFSNLFVGMIFCNICNGPMTIYYGRNKDQKYLRCYNRMRTFKRYGEEKKQFQCTNGKGIKYNDLEKAILNHVPEFKLHEIFSNRTDSNALSAIAKRLIEIETELDSLDQKNTSLVDELSETPKNIRHIIRSKLSENSEKQQSLETEKSRLEIERNFTLTADQTSEDIEKKINEERKRWPELSGEDLYRSRSRVHTAYKRFIQFMIFYPETQEVMVSIANGFRAYRFKDGKLLGMFDAVASGHVSDRPGSLELKHFANDVPLEYDDEKNLIPSVANAIAERIELVKSLYDAKKSGFLPNPINPRLNDPDVIALKAERAERARLAEQEKAERIKILQTLLDEKEGPK